MIFLNQKMNLTKDELNKIIDEIKDLDVVLIPTMPLLSFASEHYPNIGSQEVSEFEIGAYTGQTSVQTLKSLGVKYCLIGHSEKRIYLNETDDKIIKKIELCIKHGIIPIFIVGETLTEYEENRSKEIIEKEITSVFNNLHCDINNIMICYEPNWSVGANAASSEFIKDMAQTIKSIINDYYGVDLPLVYGGGVNEDNIKDINAIKEIEGVLVGGASLNSERIMKLYELTK